MAPEPHIDVESRYAEPRTRSDRCMAEFRAQSPGRADGVGAPAPSEHLERTALFCEVQPHLQRRGRPRRPLFFHDRWLVTLLILVAALVRCSHPAPNGEEPVKPPGAKLRQQVACLVGNVERRGAASVSIRSLDGVDGDRPGEMHSAECLPSVDSVAVRAGDEVGLYSRESAEWTALAGDHGAAASYHNEEEASLRGRLREGEHGILTITTSGMYHILVRPASPTSLSPAFHLRVVVTSGYSFAPASKACFVRPPDGNITFTGGESEECILQNSSSAVFLQKDIRPALTPEEVAAKATAALEAAAALIVNSTNGTTVVDVVAEAPPFQLCYVRNCLTVRVRRYDAFGNAVHDPSIVDTVSVELMGLTASDLVPAVATEALDYDDHRRTLYTSAGSTRTYETYQVFPIEISAST